MTNCITIIRREIEAREAFPNEYDPDITNAMKEVVRLASKAGHYREWCRDPSACVDKGYCPRDPNCAD